MRILFIQEDAISESLGVCALSAYLKEKGHQCSLILMSHCKDLLQEVSAYKPDLFAFTVWTGMQSPVYRIINQLKEHFDIPNVVGGPHCTFYPREAMEECSCIDYLCRGDGEFSLSALVSAIEAGKDTTHITGIWCRDEQGNIIDRSISPLIKDITKLPTPDRDLYYKYDFIRDFPMKRFVTGYGCPYKCSFCNQPFFEQEYTKEYSARKSDFMRFKTVDQIIEEILHVKNKTRLKRIHFSDDLFSVKKDWLREFSEKFPKIIGLPFSCNLRFDIIDQEIADLLKEAGCFGITAGVESGNERLRNVVIGKDLSNSAIVKASQLLRERGIKVYTTNIVALPGETPKEAIETINFNRIIKSDYYRVNTLISFPKTEITDYAIKEGYLPKDFGLKDLNTEDSLHIHCKTLYANEFKNISCMFRVLVKFPFLMRFINSILRVKNNRFYRVIGMLNLFQELNFFGIDLFSAVRFYLNTIAKKKDASGMHWIPGMKKPPKAEESSIAV